MMYDFIEKVRMPIVYSYRTLDNACKILVSPKFGASWGGPKYPTCFGIKFAPNFNLAQPNPKNWPKAYFILGCSTYLLSRKNIMIYYLEFRWQKFLWKKEIMLYGRKMYWTCLKKAALTILIVKWGEWVELSVLLMLSFFWSETQSVEFSS